VLFDDIGRLLAICDVSRIFNDLKDIAAAVSNGSVSGLNPDFFTAFSQSFELGGLKSAGLKFGPEVCVILRL